MTIKLTPASFLSGVRQSGLIDSTRLDGLLVEMQQTGVDQSCATALATALVRLGAITEWQSEKLLQGRHKGFLLGRYKLLSLLGAGEMSAVYLAEHVMLERRCAIKVLPGNKVKDTSYLGRFHREAKAVARLDHPNIVRAYDVDQQFDSGTEIHFLVMEYVAGRNIEKVVSETGPLDFVVVADYVRQAADGLSHAHQAGMVHRDIKPENLLIDNDGTVKILDLGLARFFQQSEEESLTIKHDEKVLGTADYLAPEQAIDSHKVDARADIYSLGCTMYFALTGRPPFTEGTLVQRLFAHQTKTPKPVKEQRRDVPDALLEILDKMMAKKASDRFQTARDLAQTLTRWLVENAGQAWRMKHVIQVVEVKGMDGFNFNSNSAVTTDSAITNSTTSVTVVPVTQAVTVPETPNVRSVRNPAPTVEFYTPSAPVVAVDGRGSQEFQTVTVKRDSAVARVNTTTDDQPATRRLRPEQDVRRRKVKPRISAEGDSFKVEQSYSSTATAVAVVSPTRRNVATAPRTSSSSRQVSDAPLVQPRSNGLLSWLSSNEASHVETRRMVAWVTLAAVGLICFSGFVFWIIQNLATSEKQTVQPQQDAVIDASPRSPRD